MTQTLAHLITLADIRRNIVWDKLRRIYPNIQTRYPAIVINKRLKTTGGRAFTWASPQYINLSHDLLLEHGQAFIDFVVPHELAHLVAYTIYNDNGHGNGWKTVMMKDLGITPERCHPFGNTKWAASRAK